MTSANSSDGFDGDWETAATIQNNPVMARGVQIDFAGKSWFKLQSEGDVGQILEIEAFDMTDGGTDTWFFMGTSISQMGLKQQETDSTTAQLIHARFPEYTPAMLRGGIGCINSTEVVEHLGDYLEYAGNVKYWAIEMGTNDAWGGGDWNLSTFVANMQTIIDSAKAHGITPVIARIIATDSAKAGWQIHPRFLDALDSLVRENGLPQGPDFYSHFLEHPEWIGGDGVHPEANSGGKAMHRLWAEALSPLYEKSDSSETALASNFTRFAVPQVSVQGKNITLSNVEKNASVRLVSVMGHVEEIRPHGDSFQAQVASGRYVLLVHEINRQISIPVSVK